MDSPADETRGRPASLRQQKWPFRSREFAAEQHREPWTSRSVSNAVTPIVDSRVARARFTATRVNDMSTSLRAKRAESIDLPRDDFQSRSGTAVCPSPPAPLRSLRGSGVSGQLRPIDSHSSGLGSEWTVGISPSWAVKRHSRAWDGMAAEIIQATTRQRIDIRFRAPVHLLVVGQRGERIAGETLVEGVPRSTLHDLAGRLTFVPAGHDYHDWQDPRILTRSIYFYFDPNGLKAGAGDLLREEMAPRLFFQNKTLLETAQKL